MDGTLAGTVLPGMVVEVWPGSGNAVVVGVVVVGAIVTIETPGAVVVVGTAEVVVVLVEVVVVVVVESVVVVAVVVVVLVEPPWSPGPQSPAPQYCSDVAVFGKNRRGPWWAPHGAIVWGVAPVTTSNWVGMHCLAKRTSQVPVPLITNCSSSISSCGHATPSPGMR